MIRRPFCHETQAVVLSVHILPKCAVVPLFSSLDPPVLPLYTCNLIHLISTSNLGVRAVDCNIVYIFAPFRYFTVFTSLLPSLSSLFLDSLHDYN
jgi:hypothetical protein